MSHPKNETIIVKYLDEGHKLVSDGLKPTPCTETPELKNVHLIARPSHQMITKQNTLFLTTKPDIITKH